MTQQEALDFIKQHLFYYFNEYTYQKEIGYEALEILQKSVNFHTAFEIILKVKGETE